MSSTDDDGGYWIRWVALICAVLGFLFLVLGLRFYSIIRIHRGGNAVMGTSWMLPPSYQQGDRPNRDEIPAVAAPPYNPSVGEFDAGYYDANGNFVSKEIPGYTGAEEPPEEAYRANTRPYDEESGPIQHPDVVPTYSSTGADAPQTSRANEPTDTSRTQSPRPPQPAYSPPGVIPMTISTTATIY